MGTSAVSNTKRKSRRRTAGRITHKATAQMGTLISRIAGRINDKRWTGIVPRDQVADLLFGQQHVTTQNYFAQRVGVSHTVPLPASPHAQFAVKMDDESAQEYLRYLEVSWTYYDRENTIDARIKRLERYRQQIRLIGEHGAVDKPIRIYQRPDGRQVIIDGTHRASIALALGLDLPAVIEPARVALRSIVNVPSEFYGSRNRGMPYQSIYFGDEVIVAGRRPDMLRRMNMIRSDDLKDASVLDLGCNVGSNCFLAIQGGARSAHGLEVSPRIATAAIRLNTYFAAPCRFTVHDLTTPFTPDIPYDVVFCFSVVGHLSSVDAIVETIRASTAKVLYFEAHAGKSRDDYPYLLNLDLFSTIELIGYGQSGIHDSALNRPLYRCEV